MSNPTGKGGFGERKQQIWRKGRPKEFNALRDLAQAISQEVAIGRDKETGVTSDIIIAGHRVTVAEKILRDWARSGDWQRQKGFIEIAFGKVPDEVNVGFNFAKMTDAQLTKFIEGALAAVGAGIDGSATAGPANPTPMDNGDLPSLHPAG